jgi:hypothetical protein
MKEKQKIWVVWEAIEDNHFGQTNTSFNIIGIYANEKMAKEVSYRSIKYSIEEVELNAE